MNLKTTLTMMQAYGALAFSAGVIADSNVEDHTTDRSEQVEVTPTTNDSAQIELDALAVKGRALSLYKEDESTLGTRTSTPIDETPQSIQVLPKELIEDQAANQISDLYRSISGVSYNNFSTVTMRGFAQDEVLYDGMKGDPYKGFSIPQLFTIQEVQVLKGPSGALYGAGDSGGTINYVTKKPTYEQKNTLEVTAGNKDFLSGSIESSGPANESGSQRYRVGIYSSGEDSYRNNVEEENENIDLGYAWDLDEDSTLTLQYTHIYQHIDGARLRGIPTDDDGNFLADTSWNNNEPSDYQELKADVFQATLDHEINSWLSNHTSVRYFENTETQNYHELKSLSDTDSDGVADTATREYRDQVWNNKGLNVSSYFVSELGKHTLVTGADYYYNKEDYAYYKATGESAGVSNLSLTNPVYDDDVSDYTMSLSKDETTELNQVGAFIQDQWKVTDKLSLLGSGRLDYMQEDYTDHKSDTDASYNDVGYSTRFGATYDLNRYLKPYVSYSTGFSPQSASDQQTSEDGSLFDPEESQQYELGVRTYLFNNRLNLNLAVYHIERKNMLAEDPDDDDYNIAIGKIRSQGFEADALIDITKRWLANISYAYNDVKVTDTDDAYRYEANMPHHQLGVWTRYDFPSITSSIGFGADYVSTQKNRDNQTVKSYTVYDASWQTVWEDWKFQANIKNLFDKKYAISGFTETIGSYVGERRRVYLSASYDF
ncbi:TonB-dependent receptor [Marinomonas arenicola]|uniref:TonB-dependent siderophore receptor n=1 Tax=Marinomonas arenicola TaxID=569601 RepID=UPI00311EEF5A